jgi:hypothetical protein
VRAADPDGGDDLRERRIAVGRAQLGPPRHRADERERRQIAIVAVLCFADVVFRRMMFSR